MPPPPCDEAGGRWPRPPEPKANFSTSSHTAAAEARQPLGLPNACDGCLSPAPRLRPLLLASGRFLLCPPCRRAASKMLGGKRQRKPAKAQLLEPASESDRLWFARHHGRSHRIRAPIGGERLMGGGLIAVRQIRPGVRLKASVVWIGGTPLNSEAAARAAFEAVAELRPQLAELESSLRELAT